MPELSYVSPQEGPATGKAVDRRAGWREGGGQREGGTLPTLLLLAVFLTQELENGGEIFIGVTARAHHAVNLVRHGAEWDRSLCVGGRVLCKAQVLWRERENERGGGGEKQTFIRQNQQC